MLRTLTIIFITIFLLANQLNAKALCYGKVQSNGKCPGWRYFDSDYFGSAKSIGIKDEKGRQIKAALLSPAMSKSRFLLITSYFGKPPQVSSRTGIRIKYKTEKIAKPFNLELQISCPAKGFKRGKCSKSMKLPEGKSIGNGWNVIKVPTDIFGIKEGTAINRVWVIPEQNRSYNADAKLFVQEISVIRENNLKYSLGNSSPSYKEYRPKDGKRYCAIFPKPFWYTDKETFYAPEVYEMLYKDGFNVIGVPGSSPNSVKPEDLQKRVRRYSATARALHKYPGMYTYPKLTMCWSYPVEMDNKVSKVVWFNGYEAALACPVDDTYWRKRIIPYCLEYVKISKETKTFAIMFDWEIYVKNKFRNVYGLCYCNNCWKRFKKETGISLPQLSYKERNKYLITHNLRQKYSDEFYKHLHELGKELRQKTDEINPELSYWFLPGVGGAFLTNLAKVLATEKAPIICTNENTYGKPSLALSDDEGVESVVRMVKHDLNYLRSTKIPFKYLAAIMPDQNPEFHGRQAIATGKLCDGIWIWELGKAKHYKHGRRKVMDIMCKANKVLRDGTFTVPPEWLKKSKNNAEKIPEGKTGVGISGIKAELIKMPSTYHIYDLKTLNKENLKKTKLLILQNFNAKLEADSPTVKLLRDFVKNGGRLMLLHDSAYFMASPFPEIVKGSFVPKENGDGRHILDTQLHISETCKIVPDMAGKSFHCSFNDHLVFQCGSKGKIIVKDKYNYPVIIAGNFGKGRVLFNGCYYRKVKNGSIETVLLDKLIKWLII